MFQIYTTQFPKWKKSLHTDKKGEFQSNSDRNIILNQHLTRLHLRIVSTIFSLEDLAPLG